MTITRITLYPMERPAPSNLGKGVLQVSGLVIFLFLLFIAYGTLPNRWYHILYVSSGSMSPVIQTGDLIIITPPPE